MGSDTGRDPESFGLDQYWRRRVVALGGVIGTVGLVAWACTAGGGEDKKQQQPLKNAAAVGSSSPGVPSVPAATPTVTVTATAKVTQPATAAKKDGDACEPGAVVVNMTSSAETYTKGQMPQFQLTAVNTGGRACTFDVGAKSLDLRITSGSDRVWSRSQCDTGTGSSIQMLKRGIPFAGTVTWDRRRANGQCRGKRDTVRPGTYVAQVKADHVKVKKQVFRLR
ncbi:hypothetical protein J4573_30775 [Actinomadura barringtoniae]|uniref:DUF4232 domain-containing protein n=1 Tax=Actinomadura barringtoniae TaxID=1427535 RepID=A0A939PF63_9ACTN|nr:hypothetical protein [Actinomadura barringtoniae]MBO2451511.1 hypothetical protein [Actinomadura barringtoniae]